VPWVYVPEAPKPPPVQISVDVRIVKELTALAAGVTAGEAGT